MQATKLLSGSINHLAACRHGYLLYNPLDEYIGKSLDLYGEFSEGEVGVYRQLVRPGDVVIDAGANIGVFTLVFARAVGPAGRVIAFEPQRVLFQTLCGNMALNSLTNVYAYNLALGEQTGRLTVPEQDYQAPANFGGVSLAPHASGETVDVITLDSLALAHCRLIKIDVEGMERQVLLGARQTVERCKPILYVENDRPDRSPALVQLIDALGYQAYWHITWMWNPANFYRNDVNVFGDFGSGNLLCVHPSHGLALDGFERAALDGSFPRTARNKPG